jgi:adenine phosphoribosyltransferase
MCGAIEHRRADPPQSANLHAPKRAFMSIQTAGPGARPLRQWIRDVRNFPKPGIMFRDITPLLASPEAFRTSIQSLAAEFRNRKVTAVAAAEARGFIFAAPLALELNASFIPIRKPGKLPFEKHSLHYQLEYGNDTLEMHTDAVKPGDRVLLVDDLLATGGTIATCARLTETLGATVVGCAFLIELTFLNGRQRLAPHEVFSLIQYADET